jgi:hypothetical protein
MDKLESLHQEMLEAIKRQTKKATDLSIVITKSNGQIPRAFKKKG